MSASEQTVVAANTPPQPERISIREGIVDTLIITRRNLKRFMRMPQLLVFATVQPVMFLLLFNFVFGGAMTLGLGSSADYINFLIPGILVQTVVFGATNTATGLTEDLGPPGVDEGIHLIVRVLAVFFGSSAGKGRAEKQRGDRPGRYRARHRQGPLLGEENPADDSTGALIGSS
jgi:hypothetical protein